MTRQREPLAVAGIAVLALAFVLAEVGWQRMTATTLCLMTGVGATLLAVYVWRSRPRSEWLFASLGGIFCIYYAISYGFGILGTPPDFTERLLVGGLDQVNLAAIPFSLLAWFAGYQLLRVRFASRALRRLMLPDTTLGPVGPATLLVAFTVTVVARVALVVSGAGYGYLQSAKGATTSANSVIQYASEIGGFGVVVLGLAVVASKHAPDRRDGYRLAWRIMVLPELALGALVAQKSEFLLVVVTVALALVATRQLPVRNLMIIGVAAILFIFPLVDSYRSILRPDIGRQLPASEAPSAFVTALGETGRAAAAGPGEYARYTFDRTGGRFREIDRAAVSISVHDGGRPYSPWIEMPTRIATGVVPRVLWPSKPIDLYPLEVTRSYYNLPRTVLNSASLSPVGDAYRYGGLLSVGIVLLLWGGYVRLLEDSFNPRHSIWLLPLLISAIPLLRGGDLAGILVGVVRYYLIVGILYRFLFLRRRPGRYGRTPNPGSSALATSDTGPSP